jgi:hypothetical protein
MDTKPNLASRLVYVSCVSCVSFVPFVPGV